MGQNREIFPCFTRYLPILTPIAVFWLYGRSARLPHSEHRMPWQARQPAEKRTDHRLTHPVICFAKFRFPLSTIECGRQNHSKRPAATGFIIVNTSYSIVESALPPVQKIINPKSKGACLFKPEAPRKKRNQEMQYKTRPYILLPVIQNTGNQGKSDSTENIIKRMIDM